MEEPVAAAVNAHVAACTCCQAKLYQFQAEAASLRQIRAHGAIAPPAEQQPSAEHGGEPAGVGATQDWISASPVGAPGTDPFGPEAVAAVRDRALEQADLPDAIGKYKVVGWLGAGGEADIYRVVHIKLGNDLVLKLSRRPVSSENQSDLVEVGRLLVKLEHPNLVRIHDLDFHEDRPFLVMEYVHGRNLKQYAREEPVTQRRAVAIVARLAGVSAVAHRRGITHCDIKPGNVLMDEAGEPRLIDFGMARLRHAWTDRPPTSWGGTVAYMAPEQARGETDRIGPRSDIFALGGVLYFLLTGQAPFTGETWDEVRDRACKCEFEAGALRAAQVSPWLERICLKAMKPEPADRYPTAEALQKALEHFVRGPKILALAGGVAGLALCGFLGYKLVTSRVPAPPPGPGNSSTGVPGPSALSIAANQRMTGRIDLLVVKSKDGTRRRLRLEDRGSVPVRADDEIRIEARLDRPAYLYLFWVGSEGKVAPLYPWTDHDWSTRPAQERKVKGVDVPEIVDAILTIPPGSPGIETLALLARQDSPLPRDAEARLAQVLAGSPVAMPPGMSQAIWLEDGQEVVFRPADGSTSGPRGEDNLSRGIPSPKSRPSDDPVLRIRAMLGSKLQPFGTYSQAVLFPNSGGN
jgi:predicted Ser/Thr protein kinase